VRLTQWLFLLFIVTPIAEIGLFIVVGGRIGILWTLAVVFVTAIIGASLVSRQGRGELSRASQTILDGSFPGRELAHGAMILVAGALLLTPGFLTDFIGFSLLVPSVREVLRKYLARRFGDGVIIVG
jgi:UPF0716 protein FxsA